MKDKRGNSWLGNYLILHIRQRSSQNSFYYIMIGRHALVLSGRGLRGRPEFVEVKELCSEGISTLHVRWDDLTWNEAALSLKEVRDSQASPPCDGYICDVTLPHGQGEVLLLCSWRTRVSQAWMQVYALPSEGSEEIPWYQCRGQIMRMRPWLWAVFFFHSSLYLCLSYTICQPLSWPLCLLLGPSWYGHGSADIDIGHKM